VTRGAVYPGLENIYILCKVFLHLRRCTVSRARLGFFRGFLSFLSPIAFFAPVNQRCDIYFFPFSFFSSVLLSLGVDGWQHERDGRHEEREGRDEKNQRPCNNVWKNSCATNFFLFRYVVR
jgi:hypothetical protein